VKKVFALLLALLVWVGQTYGQKFEPPKPGSPASLVRRPLDGQKPVIYEDTLASDKRKKKEKKIPKKTFWGLKTRKAFTRLKSGKKVTYELFYVLKKPQDPDPYVKELYWYHRKKRKITMGPIPAKEKEFAVLLHGPYEKRVNKIVVEQGQFYVGTKTGRWETNTITDEEILLEKHKFYHGFPKDSKISYYDANQSKIEQVVPFENGEKHGQFLQYYPSGALHQEGKFEYGHRIGVWKTYYEAKKRTKLEIQYPADAFAEDTTSFRLREYNEQGLVIYDKTLEDKKAEEKRKKEGK
jgi:hypothetical protein